MGSRKHRRSWTRRTGHHRSGRFATALLVAVFALTAGATMAAGYAALADEGDDGGNPDADEGGAEESDAETRPAAVSRSGYYTAPLPTVLPPFFTDEVPPGAFCIVEPELCSEQAEQVTGPVEGALGTLEEETPPEPVQLVIPGTMPVSLIGGQTRHASLLEFDLPDVPETDADVRVEQFDLVLHEVVPPMGFESPAFRALVRALVAQIAEDPSPDPFARELENIVTGEDPLVDPGVTGVEACPVVEDWEGGENQDGRELPEVDVVFCATGVPDEDEGLWTFDLTFAAQAWIDGEIPTKGVAVLPIAPENVDYGDPDPTANFTMAYAGPEADEGERPAVRAAYREVEPLGPLTDPPPAAAPPAGEPAPADEPAATGPAPRPAAQPGMERIEAGDPEPVEAPEVALDDPAPADSVPEAAPDIEPAESPGDPSIPWYWWMLLPLGATATGLFTRALVATPGPEATGGGGALSNLIARDSAAGGSSGPSAGAR